MDKPDALAKALDTVRSFFDAAECRCDWDTNYVCEACYAQDVLRRVAAVLRKLQDHAAKQPELLQRVWPDCLDEMRAMEDLDEADREALSRLPVSKDGKRVAPGMPLYYVYMRVCGCWQVREHLGGHTVEENGTARRFGHSDGWLVKVPDCYVDRENAMRELMTREANG